MKKRKLIILWTIFYMFSQLVGIAKADRVDDLIANLKDKDKVVRRKAASDIGKTKDIRAVEPLIEALKDEDVRGNAALALGEIGDRRAVEPLILLLKDKNEIHRGNAAGALADLKDQRAVQPLLVVAKNKSEKSGVRSNAIAAVIELTRDPKMVQFVLAKDEDEEIRRNTIGAIGWKRDPKMDQFLLALLKNKEEDAIIRSTIIYVFRKSGNINTIKPLQDIAKNDPNPKMRDLAFEAVKELKERQNILEK